ncbi:MAG: hypothetical protein AAB544_01365 [Patescibacteria group bacterium]
MKSSLLLILSPASHGKAQEGKEGEEGLDEEEDGDEKEDKEEEIDLHFLQSALLTKGVFVMA